MLKFRKAGLVFYPTVDNVSNIIYKKHLFHVVSVTYVLVLYLAQSKGIGSNFHFYTMSM